MGSEDDIEIALELLNDAALGLRQAACFGDARTLIASCHTIQQLAKSISTYMGNQALDDELSVKYSIDPTLSLRDNFLFTTSSNGNNALDWALVKATPETWSNMEKDGNICEHAICIAFLMDIGFKAENLIAVELDDENSLHRFVKNFPNYQASVNNHSMKMLESAPLEQYHVSVVTRSLQTLSGHYFMDAHRADLEKFVTELKKNKITKIGIMELGCYIPEHLPEMLRFFSENKIKVMYEGIDLHEGSIRASEFIYTDNENIQFFCGDAELLNAPRFKDIAQLVIFRHPDVCNSQKKEIYKNILGKVIPHILSPNGMCLLSCFWQYEANAIEKLLSTQNHFSSHEPAFRKLPTGVAFNSGLENADKNKSIYTCDAFTIALRASDFMPRQQLGTASKP